MCTGTSGADHSFLSAREDESGQLSLTCDLSPATVGVFGYVRVDKRGGTEFPVGAGGVALADGRGQPARINL